MDRLELLQIFARVVECASFTRAADTLGKPRSTVSAAVRELEDRVGARLLHRTTRVVSPTQDGSAFYERCLRVLSDYEEIEGLFRQSATAPRGKLKVDVPGRLGRLIIAPALPDFFARHPNIELHLGVTDRAVDLTTEGIDCVLRVGALPDSGMVAYKLGELDLINCASPAYLAARGTPETIADLKRHAAVAYASPASGRIEDWEYVEAGTVRTLRLQAQVTVNSAEAYIACCLAGLGLIQIPAYDVQGHIAAGELVEVMPALRPASVPVSLVYPHRHHLSRRLKVFLEWIAALLQSRVLTNPSQQRQTLRRTAPA